jgi:hypothetical protein
MTFFGTFAWEVWKRLFLMALFCECFLENVGRRRLGGAKLRL